MSKFGIWLPQTISRAISSQRDGSPEPFYVEGDAEDATQAIEQSLRRRTAGNSNTGSDVLPRVRRIGRRVINSNPSSQPQSRATSRGPVPMSRVPTTSSGQGSNDVDSSHEHAPPELKESTPSSSTPQINPPHQRAIRFPDEIAPSHTA